MIHSRVFQFLKKYSTNTNAIDRLIVSAFVVSNKIIKPQNVLIKDLLITESNSNEFKALRSFLRLIHLNHIGKKLTLEHLIELFEFVISPSDKKINGAVYTPEYIRNHLVKQAIVNFKAKPIEKIIFGDISCGCGGFFLTISKAIKGKCNKSFYDIYRQNIYGLDIQAYSIQRSKIILSLLAILNGEDKNHFDFNFYLGNALNFNWLEKSKPILNNGGFDCIIGNPPYVGAVNIDSESKELLSKWSVCNTGKTDLYIPFFQIGMENLAIGGVLSYITVNTFIKSLNGRALREYFSSKRFQLKIIDFGGEQLFKNRSTYTCICVVKKNEAGYVLYSKNQSKALQKLKTKDFVKVKYKKLSDGIGWSLHQTNIKSVIDKIESFDQKLGEVYNIRNGFATLLNDAYLFRPVSENKEFYFLKVDGKEFRIEKNICKDAIKPNVLKSEREIEGLKEKLIFPYSFQQESPTKPSIFSEKVFRENYPKAYAYLKSFKPELAKRDKGKKKYEKWYAYGRNQALNIRGYKLLFPYIAEEPLFVLSEDKELLFYNGYALVSENIEDLLVIKKILKSSVFWYYIKTTSKPYSGKFFSLAKNYIKRFSICPLNQQEKQFLINTSNQDIINEFLGEKYGCVLNPNEFAEKCE